MTDQGEGRVWQGELDPPLVKGARGKAMRGSRSRERREGFTAVELLVVIAIIIILMSLLLAGVNRVFIMQSRTETASEITKMSQSLEAAKAAYGNAAHLPSRLILHNDVSRYSSATATALEKQSANVLRYMFGRRFLTHGTPTWSSTGASVTLEGPEVLVFYLGGMPDATGRLTGFSKDPRNPTAAAATAGEDRLGPFYQFKSTRLVRQANGYLRYLDPYGTPYVFFGALSPNNYDSTETVTVVNTKGVQSTVSPYFEFGSSPTRWLNPDTFQIVSAGRDGLFGPGGGWDPRRGTTGSGEDDLANFSQTELGNPQE